MAANWSLRGGAGLKRESANGFLTFAATAAAHGGSIFALFVFKKMLFFVLTVKPLILPLKCVTIILVRHADNRCVLVMGTERKVRASKEQGAS